MQLDNGLFLGYTSGAMRALILESGSQDPKLAEKQSPSCEADCAKIRLHAAGWNRRDYWITQGKYPGIQLPVILGSDGCGVVEECPSDFNLIGQEVIICPSINWGDDPLHQSPQFHILGMPSNGTFAEEIVVPVENIFAKPSHLSEEQAAALPLAGLTAWRATHSRAQIEAGEKVLVTGIGGSTAIFAMQIALAKGAEVYVSSSSLEKIEKAKQLGATDGVLYNEEKWEQRLRKQCPSGFDVIIDSAGGEGFGSLVKLLGMGGRLVFFGGTKGRWPAILPQYLFFKQVSILASTMGSLTEFSEMLQFIENHQLKPIIDSVFPLESHDKALEQLVSADRFGKIILQID